MVRYLTIVGLLGVSLLSFGLAQASADEQAPKAKSVIIIGASSLASPLHEWVSALLESNKTPMNVEQGFFGPAWNVERMLRERRDWDYVIMDAWQFKRGGTDAPGFPDAVADFVKQARAYIPRGRIILFPWWIPSGRDATNEGVMQVFHRCVDAARENDIWVATTGPAFMEARLARPDLRVTVSEQDAHPGVHGVLHQRLFALCHPHRRNSRGTASDLKETGKPEGHHHRPGRREVSARTRVESLSTRTQAHETGEVRKAKAGMSALRRAIVRTRGRASRVWAVFRKAQSLSAILAAGPPCASSA
jgi:hypothetical protein